MLIGSTEQQLKEMEDYLRKNDAVEYAKSDSFKQHGFEIPSFAGEILKKIDGYHIGYIQDHDGISSVVWYEDGVSDLQLDKFNLTPIKKEWYEYPENFPALVWYKEDLVYIVGIGEDTLLKNVYWNDVCYPDDCILATKAELMSLYAGDE